MRTDTRLEARQPAGESRILELHKLKHVLGGLRATPSESAGREESVSGVFGCETARKDALLRRIEPALTPENRDYTGRCGTGGDDERVGGSRGGRNGVEGK